MGNGVTVAYPFLGQALDITEVVLQTAPHFDPAIFDGFRAVCKTVHSLRGCMKAWFSGKLGFGALGFQKLQSHCACRKSNPAILVMQSAQDWATKNVPGAIDGARDRRIFVQG